MEEYLKAMSQDLNSKQEELNISVVSVCTCGTWQHSLHRVNLAVYHILLHYHGYVCDCICDSKE